MSAAGPTVHGDNITDEKGPQQNSQTLPLNNALSWEKMRCCFTVRSWTWMAVFSSRYMITYISPRTKLRKNTRKNYAPKMSILRVNNQDLAHSVGSLAKSQDTVCPLGNIPEKPVYDLFRQSQLAVTPANVPPRPSPASTISPHHLSRPPCSVTGPLSAFFSFPVIRDPDLTQQLQVNTC